MALPLLADKWPFESRKCFLGGERQRRQTLDDIYDTKRGAASLIVNRVGRTVVAVRAAVKGYGLRKEQSTMSGILTLAAANSASPRQTTPFFFFFFCLLITMHFRALALCFLHWEVDKYWFSCQIKRMRNVNSVSLESSKCSRRDADVTSAVSCQVGGVGGVGVRGGGWSRDGRVVKASDLKSSEIFLCRFEGEQ